MPYDPNKHRRRSIRLRGYDYATPCAYFVTICVQGRRCLFGAISGGELVLNGAGQMVQGIWETLPERFLAITPDLYVIMPNHFHAIVTLAAPPPAPDHTGASPSQPALGDIVGAFKSLTTNAYIQGVRDLGWTPFERRLWQRNYYEHIVRDETALARIREYVQNNPARWDADQLHPTAAPNRLNQE